MREGVPRGVPEQKGVPGTGFVVDGFKAAGNVAGATAFFLTHAHGDHYGGIERWNREFYCSTVTAALVCGKFGLDPTLATTIDPGQTVEVLGVAVTAVDANHCPGAVQFLFEVPGWGKVIHSGDCRYTDKWKADPHLRRFRGATALYLDTTYCHPKHKFPPQEDAIQYVVSTILQREAEAEARGKQLFLISSYNIGKERIFMAVATATGKKLYADAKKRAHLERLGMAELTAALTDDPAGTNIHLVPWGEVGEVWPFFRPNFVNLEKYRLEHGAEEAVGFVPSGWAYEGKGSGFSFREKGPDRVHLVPYSEHSSYDELREYVSWIRPERVVPTVGLGKEGVGGKEAAKMLAHFVNLVDEKASKRRFLSAFGGAVVKQEDGAEDAAAAAEAAAKKKKATPTAAGGPVDGPCHRLMAATGLTSLLEAEALLERGQGSVEAAANLYLDSQAGRSPGAGPKRGKGKGKAPARAKKKPKVPAGQLSLSSFFASKGSCWTAAPGPSQEQDASAGEETPGPAQDGGDEAPGEGAAATPAASSPPAKVVAALTPLQARPAGTSEASGTTRVDTEEADYRPVEDAMWGPGAPCPYLHLAAAFELVTATKKRLLIRRYLTNMFRSVFALSPTSLCGAVYLTVGRIGPEHEKAELGVGGSTVAQCVSEVTGVSRAALRSAYKEEGDLGDVACLFKASQRLLLALPPLTLDKVVDGLAALGREDGPGSLQRKQARMKAMLRACRGPETRYLVRTLLQCMRIGANRTSVLQALARAAVFHHEGAAGAPPTEERLKAAVERFERAYNLCPDLEALVPQLATEGVDATCAGVRIKAGVPVKPMLAKPSTGIEDAVAMMGGGAEAFIAEFKYDGQRCQIQHFAGRTRLWSRNLEEKTAAFPDAVELFQEALAGSGVADIVVDCELVGIAPDAAAPAGYRFLSFQELSSRPRGEVAGPECAVAVALFAFDVLQINGESLVAQPLAARRARLAAALPGRQLGRVELARAVEISAAPGPGGASPEPAAEDGAAEDGGAEDGAAEAALTASQEAKAAATREALLESLRAGCEGVMLKPLRGPYEPGRRSDGWVKLKKDYVKSMQDSIDLVVIGAWHGNGRKAGWYSPYLLAAWCPESEEYQSVCRVMSGFSDEFYKASKAFFDDGRLLDGPKPYYATGESCAVWFQPCVVWEIRGADISVSPVHGCAAGRVHAGSSRGLALRFPRFLRERPDKAPEMATTADEVLAMFRAQTVKWDPAAEAAKKGRDDDNEGAATDGDEDAAGGGESEVAGAEGGMAVAE